MVDTNGWRPRKTCMRKGRIGTGAPADGGAATTGHHQGVNESAPDTRVAELAHPVRALPEKVVFRIPRSAYVAIAFIAMCCTFVSFAAPWLNIVYLLPVGAIVYTVRTRTEVDADRIVVHTVGSRTIVPWSAVTSLHVADRGWVRVVRADGLGEIALPSVRTRHLPALSLISRGRIDDPTVHADLAEQTG